MNMPRVWLLYLCFVSFLPKCYKVTNCYVKYIFLLFKKKKNGKSEAYVSQLNKHSVFVLFCNWCKRWRTPF